MHFSATRTAARIALLIAGLASMATQAEPLKELSLRHGVFEPTLGVAVCDRRGGFCADHEGLSMGWTREYLGDAAQSALIKTLTAGGGEAHTDVFTLSNGRHCDSAARTCWTDRYREKVDGALTDHLYGHVR